MRLAAGIIFQRQVGFAELLQRAMHANFHGAGFAAEQARDFLVLQFLKAAKHQNFPLVFGKLHERALKKLRLLLSLGGVARVRACHRLQFFSSFIL